MLDLVVSYLFFFGFRLAPIKEECEKSGLSEVTWEDLKVTVALLTKTFGVTDNKVNWSEVKLRELGAKASSVTSSASPTVTSKVTSSMTSTVDPSESPALKRSISTSSQAENKAKKLKKNSLFK